MEEIEDFLNKLNFIQEEVMGIRATSDSGLYNEVKRELAELTIMLDLLEIRYTTKLTELKHGKKRVTQQTTDSN